MGKMTKTNKNLIYIPQKCCFMKFFLFQINLTKNTKFIEEN